MTNVLMLVGRICKDLELRTNGDKSICKILMAVQNGKDDTTFIEVTAFGKTAETTKEYCRKGDLIGITGMIKNNNWTDDKGNKHYDYSFIANKITFLSTKPKETTNSEEPGNDKSKDSDPFASFNDEVVSNNMDYLD